MSVRLFGRMEQLGVHPTDFYEIWYLIVFRKICRENLTFIKFEQG